MASQAAFPRKTHGKNHKSAGFVGTFLCPVLAVQRSHKRFHLLMDRHHYSQFAKVVKRRLGRPNISVERCLRSFQQSQ